MSGLRGRLPTGFDALQPWVDTGWSLTTETARTEKRHNSEMVEIETFANAMLAEIDRVTVYLNDFSLDALPEDASRLYFLMMSLAEVAPAVELYRQPAVIGGYDYRRFVADEESPLRPTV